MITMDSPTVTTMDYVVQSYRNGKPCGIEQFFSSMGEIKYYLSDSNGRCPAFTIVKSSERIADASPSKKSVRRRKDLDGMIVEERRWRRCIGDMDLRGTRIYE